jgi:class 3 adenylate cyclase
MIDSFGRPGAAEHGGQDLSRQLERDFDRRALFPRLIVLAVLLVGALLDRDPAHAASHWTVLAAYGGTTFAIAAAARLPRAHLWLPWVGTVMDAAVAVYAFAAHLPRSADEAHRASDALSLFPALLFLLQTGLRLRPILVLVFAGVVIGGSLVSVAALLGAPSTLFATNHGAATATGLVQGLAAFLAATLFTLSAVSWMRRATEAAWREREDRILVSRFLPEGIAGRVVRGGEAAERHACLLSVDIRGSSSIGRDYAAAQTVAWLLTFRRIVHEAVSWRRGMVDKYIGDGVLALFLAGTPGAQAEDALAAARAVAVHLDAWNIERHRTGDPPLRTIMSLHGGTVLAGVFDDGHRAEFTVLGAPMNALSRIERRAKDAGVDVVASLSFIELLGPALRTELRVRPLAAGGEADLPDLGVLSFVRADQNRLDAPASDSDFGSGAARVQEVRS